MRFNSGFKGLKTNFSKIHLHLLILTDEFAVDLGSCSFPGKDDRPLFVTGDQSIPVKNTTI